MGHVKFSCAVCLVQVAAHGRPGPRRRGAARQLPHCGSTTAPVARLLPERIARAVLHAGTSVAEPVAEHHRSPLTLSTAASPGVAGNGTLRRWRSTGSTCATFGSSMALTRGVSGIRCVSPRGRGGTQRRPRLLAPGAGGLARGTRGAYMSRKCAAGSSPRSWSAGGTAST